MFQFLASVAAGYAQIPATLRAVGDIPVELLDEALELLRAVQRDANEPLRRRVDAGRIMDHLALCTNSDRPVH